MFALLTKKFTKKPKTSSAFSEFMRNASAREQKRVFKKVIEESIKDQQAIIEQARRIKSDREKGKDPDLSDLPPKTR